jgi:uncharacterized membrane protein YhhN
MKKRIWVFLFFLVLVVQLFALVSKNRDVQYVSKPLIVVSLILFYFFNSRPSTLKKWILFALVFSLAGDVLLLFDDGDSPFFLYGLSAFLLAHIFYILFFHRLRLTEEIHPRPWYLVGVVFYYGALIYLLSPQLGKMKLPVRIYGIVISFMLLLALHMLFLRNKAAGRWMAIGAVLFVISDSLLAINKFYIPFAYADVVVILSYALAQFCITWGATNYLDKRSLRVL